jgi:hypothetical protein
MPFDNRYTVATRRKTLLPPARDPWSFAKGLVLGVAVAAASAIFVFPPIFATGNRAPLPPAHASSEKPAASPAAARAGKADEAPPVALATANVVSKSDPVPIEASPAVPANPQAAGARPDAKPQVQREEGKRRHRRERRTPQPQQDYARAPSGWFTADSRERAWNNYYRERTRREWSW